MGKSDDKDLIKFLEPFPIESQQSIHRTSSRYEMPVAAFAP